MIEPRDIKRYQRELVAMLLRAGDEDPEGFAQIAQLLQTATQGLDLAANLTKAQHGYSWRQLAAGLGEAPATVHARYQLAPGRVDTDFPLPEQADTIKALIRRQVRTDV